MCSGMNPKTERGHADMLKIESKANLAFAVGFDFFQFHQYFQIAGYRNPLPEPRATHVTPLSFGLSGGGAGNHHALGKGK